MEARAEEPQGRKESSKGVGVESLSGKGRNLGGGRKRGRYSPTPREEWFSSLGAVEGMVSQDVVTSRKSSDLCISGQATLGQQTAGAESRNEDTISELRDANRLFRAR